MHSIKWLLVLALYATALIAAATGHSNYAIAVAIFAVVATIAALEPHAELDDDELDGLTVERLALVLVYAWQHMNATGAPATPWFVAHCRAVAIGVEAVVDRG